MKDITLEELLEAGCHFGHQVNRRNPKANEFIFEEREGVHIINLEATRNGLMEAAAFVKELSQNGGKLVVVATKRQARPIVKELIEKVRAANVPNLYFVTSRWIGGTLTNFEEVKKNYKKLNDIAELLKSGKSSGYTKRELVQMEKEMGKLEDLYGGMKDLTGMPDALFIVDVHLETTAVAEAGILGVTRIGIVDTNADPAKVEHSIPANDDAVGSIKIITEYIIDAWIEGAQKAAKNEEKKAAEKEKTDKKEAQQKASDEKQKVEEEKVKKEKKTEEKPIKKKSQSV